MEEDSTGYGEGNFKMAQVIGGVEAVEGSFTEFI
jgi:hypothetical protein